jgi:LmbE family N-acetylglucosaminyl deacetylase
LRLGEFSYLDLDSPKARVKAVGDVNDHSIPFSSVASPMAVCAGGTELRLLHAHPDDEALLTAGTMARLAAEGHRVVLVVATSGERGLAAATATGGKRLGDVRVEETHASAQALGCARWNSSVCRFWPEWQAVTEVGGRVPFASADLDEAAEALAEILREEDASLLTTYDPAGGYGHPDHVQVHRVGAARHNSRGRRWFCRRRWTATCCYGHYACCGGCTLFRSTQRF